MNVEMGVLIKSLYALSPTNTATLLFLSPFPLKICFFPSHKRESESFAMNGPALPFLRAMTQLQDKLQKELLIDQIHHDSPTGRRQEEVLCIIGF